jgi:hypothetical protein
MYFFRLSFEIKIRTTTAASATNSRITAHTIIDLIKSVMLHTPCLLYAELAHSERG